MKDTGFAARLSRLAGLYGVQKAYYGVQHHRHVAGPESLMAVLAALGAPVASSGDIRDALREKELSVCKSILEPVTVAWDGAPPIVNIKIPATISETACTARLELESGESREWKINILDLPLVAGGVIENYSYFTRKLALPGALPSGYQKLVLKINGRYWETLIISAPRHAFSPPKRGSGRAWGTFLPLYALRTADDWGAGDYTGLERLAGWVGEKGGHLVGTLPLLHVFLDNTVYDPSPYAPVSRLLWNEFYVDIKGIPELAECPRALELVGNESFRDELQKLREKDLVDYRGVMAVKRRVMEELADHRKGSGAGEIEFRRFCKQHPLVCDYARFRAVMEKQGKSWYGWPERLRSGELSESDCDPDPENYHLYAQWQAHRQIEQVAGAARKKDIKLYFDLPLGVHPDGYDVWKYRDIFTGDIDAGAPPDPVFTTGQNWGFRPLHPEKIREQGYRYVRDYISHHLKHASMLRIDHVMQLHRLFWIPKGMEAGQGAYVRYHPEEFYAIMSLESHRHRSIIVGEDLGIVPAYIRPSMSRHGLHRMYVLYYELADNAERVPRSVPRKCIAALNTHDMPPFAAFWEGSDIREKQILGLVKENEVPAEARSRRETVMSLAGFLKKNHFLKGEIDIAAALRACIGYLGSSEAHTVLLNLEDLWLEKRSQNYPGSGDRFPNWRHKTRYTLEEVCLREDVSDILEAVKNNR